VPHPRRDKPNWHSQRYVQTDALPNPEALWPEPLEGYVWVEVHGRLEHVWLEHVEVRTDPPTEMER
jgi:hypothetical protein